MNGPRPEAPAEAVPPAPPPADQPTRPPARHRRALLGVLAAVLAAVVLTGLGVAVVRVEQGLNVHRPGWTLVLREDFDGEALNGALWNAQDLPSPRNNELQYYTPAQVSVEEGRLRLGSDRASLGGREYSSGAVDTYGKYAFTYGRVEVRAQLPEMGQGVWPALWMLGAGCNPLGQPCPWPTTGANEIDIMEAVNDPSRLFTNLHYGTEVGRSLSAGPAERWGPNLAEDFHTFAVEWEQGGVVRWYLDDELVSERSAPGFFDQPMYLMMNTAIGGDWPGWPAAETPFPQQLEIDHVRVYQRS